MGYAPKIFPSLIMLFDGLKRAYEAAKDDEDSDDDSDEDDDSDAEQNILSSDEEESEFDYDETALESFITPLDDEDTCPDEYQIFRTIVTAMERENPQLYGRLTSDLTTENVKSIQEIFKLGEQRQEARRSKKIEEAGGYQFNQQSVPGQFNFSPISDNFKFGGK